MKEIYFGQIGRLKPDKRDEYCALHANTWPEVLEVIQKCHLTNYSIFEHDNIVFSYFEYSGENYAEDMEIMEQSAAMQKWWTFTKPCFEKYAFSSASEFYHDMKCIFHCD